MSNTTSFPGNTAGKLFFVSGLTGGREVFLGKDIGQSTDYSPAVAASVDSEIASIIDVAHQEALAILEAERPTLDLLAEALIEFETLDLPDLVKIFEGLRSDRAHDMDIDLSGAP